MNEPSNQPTSAYPFVLRPLQRVLHDVLAAKGNGLDRIYLGALYALNSPSIPERFSQCAQSLRELVDKLWIHYDASLKSKGPGLKTKTQVLEKSWKRIRWKNGRRVTVAEIT